MVVDPITESLLADTNSRLAKVDPDLEQHHPEDQNLLYGRLTLNPNQGCTPMPCRLQATSHLMMELGR